MTKVATFHTNSPEYPPKHREVHHDNSLCADGKRIQAKHRESGEGRKPRCDECNRLAREGR